MVALFHLFAEHKEASHRGFKKRLRVAHNTTILHYIQNNQTMDEAKVEPWPEEKLFTIEFPGHIANIERAKAALGGERAIANVCSNTRNRPRLSSEQLPNNTWTTG